ncbi:uncharacterized protein DEA37_0013703 [Paragonimus westermani]|uniref:Integrase zinc-binding domain-containing protein n=1 Tax=Paragonimus westermani TaxID=34504 RepID=A0A5J4N5S4_9TREM|nr:uncharacterized protein DEA37_0013703 [Paragonimus westermani]
MLKNDDLSPLYVKSTCAQPKVMDDRGEFRSPVRQQHVFHTNDDFESWEFAVTIYLTGVPEKSMGPYILSLLSEEAAEMLCTSGVRPTAPAAVIWETLRQFSEKTRTEKSVESFLRSPGAGFISLKTHGLRRLRTVLHRPPKSGSAKEWLRNFRDSEGQVACWQERLQEYDFVIEYRRGSRLGNADVLSRVTVLTGVNTILSYDADTLWAEDQLNDSYTVNIYKRQVGGSSKPSAIEERQKPFDERALLGHWKDLKLIDGVLYRMDRSGLKLITPKLKVAAMLQRIHTELGHAGQLKTEAAIRQRY